jgi:hypothetical protein
MALARWQFARHQLHILVPAFTSRTLYVPLRQECVPEPLYEVPDLGIDVYKEMERAPVKSRDLCRTIPARTANMAPSVQ